MTGVVTQAILCPCGSGQMYAACCGPAHAGQRLPPTAEALMRSRYTAYVRGNVAYLLSSWHLRTRPARLDLTDQPDWQCLEIVGCKAGMAGDAEGQVEFIAHFRGAAGAGQLHEVSRFVREQDRWFYVDGAPPKTLVAKPGRNAPCPCGSGRKFKHCCGR